MRKNKLIEWMLENYLAYNQYINSINPIVSYFRAKVAVRALTS